MIRNNLGVTFHHSAMTPHTMTFYCRFAQRILDLLPYTVSMSEGITHMQSQNEMILPEAEPLRNEFIFALGDEILPLDYS